MSRKQLVKLFPGEGKVFNIYVVQSCKWIEGDEFVTSKQLSLPPIMYLKVSSEDVFPQTPF